VTHDPFGLGREAANLSGAALALLARDRGVAVGHLRKCKQVEDVFPAERRARWPDLKWKHYEVAVRIQPNPEPWLEVAQEAGWPARKLWETYRDSDEGTRRAMEKHRKTVVNRTLREGNGMSLGRYTKLLIDKWEEVAPLMAELTTYAEQIPPGPLAEHLYALVQGFENNAGAVRQALEATVAQDWRQTYAASNGNKTITIGSVEVLD
jgi:hypothetical protein